MIKTITGAALVASMTLAGTAGAATMTGVFDVTVVNLTGQNSAQSQATRTNYDAALAGATTNTSDVFTYTGDLDFGTYDTTNDATTISQWLDTGVGGSVSGLDAGVGVLQLSSPDINATPTGTATTTFFLFSRQSATTAGDFTVTHDDGFGIYDDGNLLGGNVGPTSQQTMDVLGFDGGAFELLYVATNGDPSVLLVDTDTSEVPLPAAAWLFGSGLIALASLKRRKK